MVFHAVTGGQKLGPFKPIVLWIAEFPHLTRQVFWDGYFQKNDLLVENKFDQLQDFSEVNTGQNNEFLLISQWDPNYKQSIIRLYHLQDNSIIKEWIPQFDEFIDHFDSTSLFVMNDYQRLNYSKSGFVKDRARIIHPMLLKDYSIVFNFMYGPLICIDSSSKLQWIVNGNYHHSIEKDAEGNIWVPGVEYQSQYFQDLGIEDDVINKFTPDGTLLYSKSVLDIFVENGLRAYEFGEYFINKDVVHINDIQPVMKDSKYWEKGDLFISFRQGSTVFLYRPSTNEVIWYKRGPWLFQHDVDILDSNRISVFGNDVFYIGFNNLASIDHNKYISYFADHNDIYIYNFENQEITKPYTHMFDRLSINTATEGRSEIYRDGTVYVEETNHGRHLLFNHQGLIQQWIFAVEDEYVLMPGWSRRLMMNDQGILVE
ncbi:MAG: arylsulfotransferase family protein [Bacteroidetes bacterium]|nr:arylsulfotransferase family protein [Bacteroidota bacterium]